MTHPFFRGVIRRAMHACRAPRVHQCLYVAAITLTGAGLLATSQPARADDGMQTERGQIFQPVFVPTETAQPAAPAAAPEPAERHIEGTARAAQWRTPWPAAQLALVIDDLGYDRRRGLEAINLPGPLTVAVMPHTPNATFLANAAHNAGHEIILHQPMQGSDYQARKTSPKGILTLDMGPADIRFALRQSLTSVPHVIGINNHTGSTLTQTRSHMYWLMQQVASTDLYYLDSRTTTQTVAGEAAQAWGVPFVSRDVFLDHHNDADSIAYQFRRAVNLAKRRGHAILIAHPRPLSLALLAAELPALDPNEVELVYASQLIGVRSRLNPGSTAAGQ